VSTRVAVFIDYQNVYMGARSAFCPGSPSHVDGQIDPLKVGGLLKPVGAPHRELVAVRIYRGMPSSEHDPKGYGAAYRQVSMWKKHPLITPCTRPLNYRNPRDPKEKGIDVLLAVDFVLMASRKQYDVGVIFSADTDLAPALEAVIDMKSEQACEVACWVPSPGNGSPRAIGVKGHVLMRHGLGEARYRTVHDPTDYTMRRRRR
jgi:uncharacterized LabA/DUF88 family protein